MGLRPAGRSGVAPYRGGHRAALRGRPRRRTAVSARAASAFIETRLAEAASVAGRGCRTGRRGGGHRVAAGAARLVAWPHATARPRPRNGLSAAPAFRQRASCLPTAPASCSAASGRTARWTSSSGGWTSPTRFRFAPAEARTSSSLPMANGSASSATAHSGRSDSPAGPRWHSARQPSRRHAARTGAMAASSSPPSIRRPGCCASPMGAARRFPSRRSTPRAAR